MRALVLAVAVALTGCEGRCPNGVRWQPSVTQQDHRDCVFAAGDKRSIYDYRGCLLALGYQEVCADAR